VTTVDSLRSRIEAKIAEREQAAYAAADDYPAPWTGSGYGLIHDPDEVVAADLPTVVRDFVVLRQPADALAEVEHWRGILERHRSVDWYEGGVGCWYCSGGEDAEARVVDYPCPEILALAKRLSVEVTS
jgi:hypothetical protein